MANTNNREKSLPLAAPPSAVATTAPTKNTNPPKRVRKDRQKKKKNRAAAKASNARRKQAGEALDDSAQPDVRREHVPPADDQSSRNVEPARSSDYTEEFEQRSKKRKTNDNDVGPIVNEREAVDSTGKDGLADDIGEPDSEEDPPNKPQHEVNCEQDLYSAVLNEVMRNCRRLLHRRSTNTEHGRSATMIMHL